MCMEEQFKADTFKEGVQEVSTWTEIDPIPFLLPQELSDFPCTPQLISKFRLSVW